MRLRPLMDWSEDKLRALLERQPRSSSSAQQHGSFAVAVDGIKQDQSACCKRVLFSLASVLNPTDAEIWKYFGQPTSRYRINLFNLIVAK